MINMIVKEMKPTKVIGGVLAIFDDESEKELPKEQISEPDEVQ